MTDLRVAQDFWRAYEECGRNDSELARQYQIARPTLREWRRHHEEGRVWDGQSWVLREQIDNPEFERFMAWLEARRVPEAPGPTASRKAGEYATCLIGCDLHFPYVHEGAFEVFLGLCDRMQPEELVLNGDTFDWPQLSRFISSPKAVGVPLQDDIDVCREKVLARINTAAPTSTKRLILGNHEWGRFERYIWGRAPELSSLRVLNPENLLGLAEMGWYYQPHEFWPTDSLLVWHGDRHTNQLAGGSAMSARKEFIDIGCSGVSGHTHKLGQFFRQDRTGYYVWAEGGCLCDWEPMREHGLTGRRQPVKRPDWHLGVTRVLYRPGKSAFQIELIPIIDDGRKTFAVYQDEEIVA